MTIASPQMFNYYCPTCQAWRGLGSMDESKRCRECKTKCDWRRYDPQRLAKTGGVPDKTVNE